MSKIKDFKGLKVWQKAIELVKIVYRLTHKFPKEELYALTSQIRRCAVSVPSNIAEGFRRVHPKEFKQSLNISLGSLAELETQLIIANELNYLKSDYTQIEERIDHLNGMLVNLSKKL